jgi:alkanesulfonate monooxygenase SsuD/methylene tetrahydromethanopterin reductase-like flavin-dependent oxidoreductase (luciferase family)
MSLQEQNSKIRVGLFLASYFDASSDPKAELKRITSQTLMAERLGFDSVFLGHHYLSSGAFLQPIPLLSYLSAITRQINLGLGVHLISLQNPLALAEELATLNALSEGRLIAGFGAGYREKEFAAFGIPFSQRFARLEENVKVFRQLIQGEPSSASGGFGALKNASVYLAKMVTPPPIWLGAFGEIGIRRCAKMGLPWLAGPEGSEESLVNRLELYRSTASALSIPLPSEFPLVREVFVGESDKEAVSLARPYLEKQYSDYKSWDHGLTIDELIQQDAVIGSPETVAKRLNRYREIGFTSVIVRSEWPGMPVEHIDSSIELLGREVFPRLC